jgi:hypothetical protein
MSECHISEVSCVSQFGNCSVVVRRPENYVLQAAAGISDESIMHHDSLGDASITNGAI